MYGQSHYRPSSFLFSLFRWTTEDDTPLSSSNPMRGILLLQTTALSAWCSLPTQSFGFVNVPLSLSRSRDVSSLGDGAFRRRRRRSTIAFCGRDCLDGCAASTAHDESNSLNSRRNFLAQTALSISALGTVQPNIAEARGLVRFPCKEPLLNTYHFMRAGASLLEVEDVWSTNPLFLTNREAALSELGEQQVREACRMLKSSGISPTVVRYSLAAASVDSANLVGEELRVGRDRLVPEFNYMDPRAIGGWDFAQLNATEEAVWALDADEAGTYGKG